MKEFNYDKAFNGERVCLEDGTPVKIIDFDFGENSLLYKYQQDGKWVIRQCMKDGRRGCGTIDNAVLFMQAKIGYINLYRMNDRVIGGELYADYRELELDKKNVTKTISKTKPVWFASAKVEFLD